MTVLDCPIPKDAWVHEPSERNGSAGAARRDATTDNGAGPWQETVHTIEQMRQLADDWDGFGAKAPSRELLESALSLANLLNVRQVPAPSRVVPGVEGAVVFEWQLPDGTYADVEIVQPFFAEVMVLEPGKPAQHWTLPTE